MTVKILVAGCRDYNNYQEAKEYIDFCISRIKEKHELVFLSGACRGADMLGERYADEHGYEVERYPANWDKYGKSAGPIRNKKMAENADYIICFWDGKSKGTKTMINFAHDLSKPLRIKRI